MEKSQSADNICQVSTSDLKTPEEKIFTSALVPPLLLCGAYLVFLHHLSDGLYQIADSDPFKTTWWSGPIAFSIIYLIAVVVGPRYMKSRPEFKIKPYIFTYNLYQCLLNLWCVGGFIHEVWTNPIFTGIWGNDHIPGKPSFRIGLLVWIHYNNKFVELLDTLWMILRKKNNQISFLHCYHHVLLMWVSIHLSTYKASWSAVHLIRIFLLYTCAYFVLGVVFVLSSRGSSFARLRLEGTSISALLSIALFTWSCMATILWRCWISPVRGRSG